MKLRKRHLRIDDGPWAALSEIAQAKKTTASDLVREAIDDFIKRHENPMIDFIDGVMSIHEKLDTKTNDLIEQNKCILLLLQGSLASLTGKLLQTDEHESLAQYKARQKEAFNEAVGDGYRELGQLKKIFEKSWEKVK